MAKIIIIIIIIAIQQILWRISTGTGYSQKRSLSLRRVVEVRTGQQTPQFDKFPYEQVEDQSFSLLYESESEYQSRLILEDLCRTRF